MILSVKEIIMKKADYTKTGVIFNIQKFSVHALPLVL